LQTHDFGCPVYVLDASLQDGKKIPKWNPQARLGLFLGSSDLHSSQVSLVMNVNTGKISPQFHVIFDDTFQTVNSLPLNQPLDNQWAQIFRLGRECFADMDYDKNNCPILPPLSDIIKTYSDAKAKQATYAPITRTDFVRDGFNFDPDSFRPENPGPLPLAAVPSLIQNPPTTNPIASPTHNNLPQMIVPG
jgi:hypothetical protein